MVWVIILFLKVKKIHLMISLFFCMNIILSSMSVFAEPDIKCPSAILVDFDSGKVLYEKNPDEKRPMASVTKIMTMLICMEEIYAGNISYDDIVVGSANAKSYGGSTIFLDEGEKMTIRDLLKGIAVASGNDASVAVAEYICGDEKTFVERMNYTAQRLGMSNTHFVNCNGLDAEAHYSSARDIAIMSRELMKYDDIFQFTTIWMDSLRNGTFTLSNTNKLIKFYDGATGLKTGSTDDALFCISATAKRENMHLIAVIMGAETSKSRQSDASTLLNYGFANYKCEKIIDINNNTQKINITKSNIHNLNLIPKEEYFMLSEKNDKNKYEIEYDYDKKINAPVKKGDIGGYIYIKQNNEIIKEIELLYSDNAAKRCFSDEFKLNLLRVFK